MKNPVDQFKEVMSSLIDVAQIKKELTETKADRDLQLTKLQEFEEKNKDFIESAQTADQMKQAHKAEIEKLTAEYEAKLAEKAKEVVTTKEASAKEISTVKESVAQETIAIVASQGTDVVIEPVIKNDEQQISKKERTPKSKYKVISHIGKN